MQLSTLIAALPTATVRGATDITIGAVHDDSRLVQPGDLFVAVRGRSSDGHTFVVKAVAQGAVAVVVQADTSLDLAALPVPVIVVPNSAIALGILVGEQYGAPARAMKLIGVTGTNGKTTTTYLIESIIKAAGGAPGVIGTVSYRWGDHVEDAPYTTPTPHVLHRTLATMRDAGCTHVIMEVSSAALIMDRLAGLAFTVAGFSNLTQDHLDVHGTMAAYREAKQLLFSQHLMAEGTAVVNVDDAAGAAMGASAPGRVFTVASAEPTQLPTTTIAVTACASTVRGITATITTPRGALQLNAPPLVGAYNVANLALAVGIAEALAVPHAAITAGIAQLPGVPGRVERVANQADLDILVDYAHTPDALRNVLQALRPLTARRLICVFGCGGDRDPSKRPLMGAAVAELADLAIVTSDNPRTESPQAIIDMILPAVPAPFFVSTDRSTAIAAAIAEATPGDVVLIAGKGHEDYQILGTTKIHFDDREQAAAAVNLRPRWPLNEVARIVAAPAPTGPGPGPGPNAIATRVVIDSRRVAPGDLYVAICGETNNGNDYVAQAFAAGAVGALISAADQARVLATLKASQAACCIAVDDTRLALGQLGAAHRKSWRTAHPTAVPRQLVAITGSAGKTTTKELTRAALAAAGATHAAPGSLNNETGVPLTLLGLRAHHQYAVVEMGMRGRGQIEYLTKMATPDVGVVVNAGTAHMELLGSTDEIARAKAEMWLGFTATQTIVRPADDVRLAALAHQLAPTARTITFGARGGTQPIGETTIEPAPIAAPAATPATAAEGQAAPIAPAAGSPLVAHIELTDYVVASPMRADLTFELQGAATLAATSPLLGRHAAIDAACAVAAALAAGVAPQTAIAGLARARNAEMRGQVVTVANRNVIVDCYNANPASMAAALTLLAELAAPRRSADTGPKIGLAIVGDMLELGELSESAHAAVGAHIEALGLHAITFGAWRESLGRGVTHIVAKTTDVDDAARAALDATFAGDWILLKASRGVRLERVLEAMQRLALAPLPTPSQGMA